MTEPEVNVELLPCETMYRVTVREDGFEASTFVSSQHLVEEKIGYLKQRIADEARDAYLQDFDDV